MDTQEKRPVLVVLSGAGISRESGIKTFRDGDGLWEDHDVMDVATPEAWHRDPALVQRFYNARRRQLDEVAPNAAHVALAELESQFDVRIVTQNVDDLHERAGSRRVLHLHGELRKVRPVDDPGIDYSYFVRSRSFFHWDLLRDMWFRPWCVINFWILSTGRNQGSIDGHIGRRAQLDFFNDCVAKL